MVYYAESMAKNIPLPKPSQYVHDDPQQVMKTKIELKQLSGYPNPHGFKLGEEIFNIIRLTCSYKLG